MSKRRSRVVVPDEAPVHHEDDLVHVCFTREGLAQLHAARGGRAVEGIFRDLRGILCDGVYEPAELEAADMLSPMEAFPDKHSNQVLFEQKVDVL
jgi:hypothetical protein